ncbi:unnamed protein product [Heterobilharzia americana]|nr:unnamed protein product [Heterobilharzia americana]
MSPLILLLFIPLVPNGTYSFSSTSPFHPLLYNLLNLATQQPTSSHFLLAQTPQCHLHLRCQTRSFPSGFHSRIWPGA